MNCRDTLPSTSHSATSLTDSEESEGDGSLKEADVDVDGSFISRSESCKYRKKYYFSTNDQQVESPYVHNGEDNPMLFTALCCTYNMAPRL